jgi:Subtilase family
MHKYQCLCSILKRILGSLSLLMACAAGQTCVAQEIVHCAAHAQLNRFEREQFLQVSVGPRDEVSAQFLSQAGCGKQMLDGLKRLGARMDFADQTSGYVLVTIPRASLLDTLDLPGIAYAYTRDDDRLYYKGPAAKIPQSERKAEPVPAITIPYPRVATTVAMDGPYFAADEIGLTELRKQHPEADGRGVRVAVPDEGFDLLHPALQQATDATGKTVPKVADLGTLTGPDEDSGWVRFGDPIHTTNGSFDAAGRTWTVPENGTYRFGIFKTDLVLGPEDNSKTKKLSLSVGVIWDERGNRVWVDTDGDGSFKNQRALGDYGLSHDIDWFGTQDGESDNRIPFGVKLDTAKNAVYIRIGGEHGAFVAGPLAANMLTGGLFNGAAPNAQLVDNNLNRRTLVAAIVQMAARSDVDVINRSGGIGRAYPAGDSYDGREDFAQHVLERLIAVYGKPIVAYSAATGTIHVNDYAGPKMLSRNRQIAPPYLDTMNSFVWDLPNGLVNAVLAPSAGIETDSRYMPQDITWQDGKRHSFSEDRFNPPAPDGYVIGANNSPAIPVVSGLLADLISEAKREHVRYDAVRLNNAVFTGTRLLDGFPLSQQGYGLINAAQSWDQLSRMAMADDPSNPELTSFTISRVEAGHSIEVNGFHADLPEAGGKLNGEIWITRHGGYVNGRKYFFSLRGNNGSYALLDHHATLKRDKATRVRFRTDGAPGWNIVFLELRDTVANVVIQDVPLSVRVPDVPEKIEQGVEKYESTIQPLRSKSQFIRTGEDVQAVRYVMQIPYTGPCCSTRYFPGAHYRDGVTPPGEPVDAAHHVGPMEEIRSLVANDTPGTQEIFWENRGRPEYATQYDGPAPDIPIHAELTVTKYSVGIQKDASENLTVTNKLAEVDGKVELYYATLKTSQLTGTGSHASGEVERTVLGGLAQWRVRVAADSVPAEPADVYLLDCTEKEGCSVAAQQQISAPGKTIVVDKPHEGTWRIVVRSRGQMSHPVTYAVHEALLVPGPTPIEQNDSKHSSGATWTLGLPAKQSDARYAAFRIAGTPGIEREKNGLLIAITALEANAP